MHIADEGFQQDFNVFDGVPPGGYNSINVIRRESGETDDGKRQAADAAQRAEESKDGMDFRGTGLRAVSAVFSCVLAGRIHAGFYLAAPAGDASDQLSESASVSSYPDD